MKYTSSLAQIHVMILVKDEDSALYSALCTLHSAPRQYQIFDLFSSESSGTDSPVYSIQMMSA